MTTPGQKHYTCSTCGKSYRFWGGVDDCQRKHEQNLRYTCDKDGCGKGFNSKFRFQLHLRTHDGQRPFQGGGGEKFSHNMLKQILFFFYTGKIIFVVLLQTDGILNINIDFPFHPCISVSMLQL